MVLKGTLFILNHLSSKESIKFTIVLNKSFTKDSATNNDFFRTRISLLLIGFSFSILIGLNMVLRLPC